MADFDTLPTESADHFETWLAEHGSSEKQVWIEIHKKSSGRQTVSFDELLDVAICYGWIDVQTKGLDDFRYAIRFVPRKPGSNWSDPNRARVKRLLLEGSMQPAGVALIPPELLSGSGTDS